MKVGIFGRQSIPPTRAVVEGLRACGDVPVFQSVEQWSAADARRDLDAVIVFSLGVASAPVWSWYRKHGTPVFIVEQGHTARPNFHQLSFDRLNWIPDTAESDRRKMLGITKPKNGGKADGYVLFIGQKPGDAQHGGVNVLDYLTRTMRETREITQRPFVYRAHPKDQIRRLPDMTASVQLPETIALEESFAGAHSVVTFNSNAGLHAILAGIPVYCHSSALYAGACETDTAQIEEPYVIGVREWNDTINRICYAQWTEEEFKTGAPWTYIKAQAGADAVAI